MQRLNTKTNPVLEPSPTLSRKIDEIAAKLDQLCGDGVTSPFTTPQQILLSQAEVCARSGISRQQISNMIARGDFPAPVQLVGRRRAWRLADFQAWVSSRPLVGGNGNDWNGGCTYEQA
jgi:predicted DNA-binding transcriptional regulator AlpA